MKGTTRADVVGIFLPVCLSDCWLVVDELLTLSECVGELDSIE